MTYHLYRDVWYEVDHEDPSTMEDLIEDMLNYGDLDDVFDEVARARYESVSGLAEALVHDGAEEVFDTLMEDFMQECTDNFDELVMPLVEKSQEEEP